MSETYIVRCEPTQAESVYRLIVANKDRMTTNVHTLTFAEFKDNIFDMSHYYYWCDQERVRAVLWLGSFEPTNRSAEFGVIALKTGAGDGREATKALLGIAFGTLGLHRLFCRVNVTNATCLKAIEKFGLLKQEGVFRQSRFLNNEFIDQIQFSVLATDPR